MKHTIQGKTFFISGASRGIGKAIAVELGKHGANIVVAAKSVEENPKLGGTIYSAVEEIEAAGGKALAVACDIRDEAAIQNAIEKGVAAFGGIDGVINNASAISLTGTAETTPKRFDLMHDINVRGTFLVTQAALPHLSKSTNPHILTLSPPINLNINFLAPHIAYTLSKYNMTLMAIAWAAEFKEIGIASNALWPATTIATAAVNNLLGGDYLIQRSRKPQIVADTVVEIVQQNAKQYTGQQLIDEAVLKAAGVNSFEHYAVNPQLPLQKDLFL